MERPSRNRRRASRAAYAAGVLLFLTGGTGAVTLVRLGWRATNAISPTLGDLLAPLFFVALAAAALGGLTVLVGGFLLGRGQRRLGKILILLGAGVGLLTLVLHLLLLTLAGGNPVYGLVSAALTLQGLGILLAVYAQTVG